MPWFDLTDNITSVSIGADITRIGNEAFVYCTNVTEIYYEGTKAQWNNVSKGKNAFSTNCVIHYAGCGDDVGWSFDADTGTLTLSGTGDMYDYDNPYSIHAYKYVPWYDIRDSITRVEIGAGVTRIGEYAFYSCTNLTDVYYEGTLTQWNSLSKGKTAIPTNCRICAFICGENAIWSFDAATGRLTVSGEGDMYDYREYQEPWYDISSSIKSVEIGSDIMRIGDNAFSFKYLKDIYYEGTMAQWEALPKGTNAIPTNCQIHAINYCGENATWTFDDASGRLAVSGEGDMYDYLEYQQPWYDISSSIKSVEIGSDIMRIGDNAFSFKYLKDIYYEGTMAQWEALPKGTNAIPTNCTIHTNENYQPEDGETKFDETKYVVSWKNYDGSILEDDWGVQYGTMPEYNGETPTKPEDDQGAYVFSGWSPEISVVTGNVLYTAQYRVTNNKYTVTWKNWDGTVLETDTGVFEGTTPTYDGETPTKAATAQYTYTFKGWSPAVSAVDDDVTYTAVFSSGGKCGENAYWIFDEGTGRLTIFGSGEIYDYKSKGGTAPPWFSFNNSIRTIEVGKDITRIGNEAFNRSYHLERVIIPDDSKLETIADYAFMYCYDLSEFTIPSSVTNISSNAFGECDCINNIYCYANPDKLTWGTQFTKNTPTCHVPANWLEAYQTKFSSLNVDFVGDLPVAKLETFTVTWKTGDTVLETDENVPYGTTPEYNGETPTMTGNENEEFVFSGWSPMASEVTGNATYTAQFIKYTKVSAVPATYTSAGNTEYYICSDGKYYVLLNDEYTEVAEDSWIIPKLENTDEAVISFANITLGGELGLNFYVTVPDDLVSAGAKAVMNGPVGENEIILSSLTKDSDGYYKLTYKLRAIDSDKSVSLKLTDSSGKEVGLFKTNGEQITDDTFTYSIGEYVNAAMQLGEQYVTADQKEKIKAMNTYAAYSVKWKYNTPLPTDGSINELPEVAAETLAKYQLTKSGTDNVEITGASLLLDSNTAFKLYFKCDTVPDITLDGKAVVPVGSGDEYFIIVENIGVKDLKTEYTVEFGESYTVKFSALSYAYSVLKNKDSYPELISDELCDLVKAIYAYSESYVPEN